MIDIFVTRYKHNGIIVIDNLENKERFQGYSLRDAIRLYRNANGYRYKHFNIYITEVW